jgi:hypothetical protein
MLIAGYALIIIGVVFVLINEAAARKKLGINPFFGLQYGAIKLTDKGWVQGHAAARIPILIGGAIFAGFGVYVLAFPPVTFDDLRTVLYVLVLPVAACLFVGGYRGDRVARRFVPADTFPYTPPSTNTDTQP